MVDTAYKGKRQGNIFVRRITKEKKCHPIKHNNPESLDRVKLHKEECANISRKCLFLIITNFLLCQKNIKLNQEMLKIMK